MTAADHFAGRARSPWERWGWVVAGVWLVFLTYPVLETFQTDASAAVKGLVLALLASFAAQGGVVGEVSGGLLDAPSDLVLDAHVLWPTQVRR